LVWPGKSEWRTHARFLLRQLTKQLGLTATNILRFVISRAVVHESVLGLEVIRRRGWEGRVIGWVEDNDRSRGNRGRRGRRYQCRLPRVVKDEAEIQLAPGVGHGREVVLAVKSREGCSWSIRRDGDLNKPIRPAKPTSQAGARQHDEHRNYSDYNATWHTRTCGAWEWYSVCRDTTSWSSSTAAAYKNYSQRENSAPSTPLGRK